MKKDASAIGFIGIPDMDVHLGIAACSVSESKCNGGKCSSIKIIVMLHFS